MKNFILKVPKEYLSYFNDKKNRIILLSDKNELKIITNKKEVKKFPLNFSNIPSLLEINECIDNNSNSKKICSVDTLATFKKQDVKNGVFGGFRKAEKIENITKEEGEAFTNALVNVIKFDEAFGSSEDHPKKNIKYKKKKSKEDD